jgi:hypothetical protein
LIAKLVVHRPWAERLGRSPVVPKHCAAGRIGYDWSGTAAGLLRHCVACRRIETAVTVAPGTVDTESDPLSPND